MMRLVATPDNPIPAGAVVASVRAVDGVKLRAAHWAPPVPPRGTVAILGGRAEFIEKYFETIQQLLDRGFAVAAMDWRGQGGSARQLRNPRKGHIDDFSLYERDLDALVSEVLGPSCPRPWFGLCHSMGGAILLAVARAGRSPFERLVMTSPMIALASLTRPGLARFVAVALDAIGLGGAFAPGGGSKIVSAAPFEGNPLTSDPERYARTVGVIAADPTIGLGWPTVGWLHAAFRLMSEFEDPNFPRRTVTPILVIAAGADRVVDTRATERFASRLRAGRLIVIDRAEHELMVERDVFRDRFWAAFDAFIPGVEAEMARTVL
jgi:lysophospholipase